MNIATAPSQEYINNIFEVQRSHQRLQRLTTATQRIEKLKQLREAIEARKEDIKTALYQDLRKDAKTVVRAELGSCYLEIDDAIENLSAWMAPEEVETSPHFSNYKARVVYQARGIVLLFGPWNFPFSLVFQPLAQIISAGNCCIVKPNEMAPHVSEVSAEIIREVFTLEEVAVFEGDVVLANQLLELPVDHIFFTGSPAVGKLVMAAAAKHLASVTLELGGKNPVIIDRNANIADAAKKIAFSRNMNSGQVCLCPENIYVHEEKIDEFITLVQATFHAAFYIEGELNQDVQGRIVDHRNLQRIKSYIDDAKAKGAVVVCGGEVIEETLALHPTILTNVPQNAKILQEEVFGPILCVFTYSHISEVYQTLHEQPKPLAMYVFSENEEFVEEVLLNTNSGGVTVNNCMTHYSEHRLPFGGVNNSGIGCYHGIHGFRELSHNRSILYVY
jgi:aldehyde dehydrogenase (NAD+)